jgi:hypothetical protein
MRHYIEAKYLPVRKCVFVLVADGGKEHEGSNPASLTP